MHKYSEHTRVIWFDKIEVGLLISFKRNTHPHTHTTAQMKLQQLFYLGFPEMVMCLL